MALQARRLMFLCSALAFLAACASPRATGDGATDAVARPARGPAPLEEPRGPGPGASLAPPEDGVLDLLDALELAAASHPDVLAARARLEATAGEALQSGLWPNPRALAAIDSAPLEGRTMEEAEYLAGLSQTLAIGGRLGAARRLEEVRGVKTAHELRQALETVRRSVRMAFAGALHSHRVESLREQAAERARESAALAETRVRSGQAAEQVLIEIELEAELAELELERARAARERSLISLAEAIGISGFRPAGVTGALEAFAELPALDLLHERLDRNPALLAAEAAAAESQRALELAEREAIPDIDLFVNYHRFEAQDLHGFDAGLEVPIPLFDRNQGRIAALRAGARAAEEELRSRRVSLEASLRLEHARLAEELRAASRYRDEVLPRTVRLLESAQASYDAGNIGLHELLSARQRWIDAEIAYAGVLAELAGSWSRLEELAPR